MPETLVINASPLIFLGNAGQLELLQKLDALQTFRETVSGKSHWKVLQDVVPHPARLSAGFWNDHAASLWLRGKNSDSKTITWRYDMVNDKSGWRVHDGWWETRFDGVE